MGNGYLGKISAIVSANTGDFKPKLDAAASDVQKFARSVEGTLRSATSRNAKAFEGIWSPFQKMERAIQAANSMKLSFKGFEAAIRDVDALNSRLAALAKRQVSINVSGTGFSDVSSLREAFRGIKSNDVAWVRSLGGLSQARALRGAMTDKESATLDKFSKFGSLERMDRVVATMNNRAIDESNRRLRQMTSAAVEIAGPLTQAQQLFGSFSLEIQGQFAPALNKASQGVENLKDSIERGSIDGKYFSGVRQRVEQTIAAISRLNEAQHLSRSGMTGKELAFQAPFVADELSRSAALSRVAATAPSAIRSQPAFLAQVEQLNALRTKIEMYRGSIERRQLLGMDTTEAVAKLDALIAKSKIVRESLESMMTVRSSGDVFGAMLGSVESRSSDLESRIKSVQGAIAQLPLPLQSKMLPALAKARDAFAALGKNPTAAELAKAAQQAENLERNLKRAQAAAQFRGTFRTFLNDNAANTYVAQLNAIRQGLTAVGATAGGPVAAAVNRYQRALYDAAKGGRLATEDTKKQMDELLQKIAQVAVAQGNMSKKQATAFVQMVQRSSQGDISRMGMGNFNLAMQQAAFALDDFMSSTGGIEFKLRAISNNLTQMAFILGSTKGLWIAVGAVMATTLGIPILKAIFDFDRFENQNKALNEELKKSESIAERTAEAYKELGKALRESGMGGAAGKVAAFTDERRKAASDAARSSVLQRTPAFAEAQSRVLSLEQSIEKETDIGRRGALLRQLEEAKRQRDAIRDRAITPPSIGQVNSDIDAARAAEISLRRSSRSNWEMTDAASARRARAAAGEGPSNATTQEEAIKALDRQIAFLGDAVRSANFFERTRADYVPEMSSEASGVTRIRRAREQIAKLEEERARIQADVQLQRNERFMPRAMAAAAAVELNPIARDRVARLGLDSDVTSRFESDIEKVSKEFDKVITDLEKAVREGTDTSKLEKAADDAARALEYLYQEADKFARDVSLGALVPTKQRLERAAEEVAGLGPSNVGTAIAQAQAAREQIENQRERARVRGDEFGVNFADLLLESLRRLTSPLESAAIAVASFQRAVEAAAMSLSQSLVEESKQRSQELRRAANRFSGDPAFREAANAAEIEARRQAGRDRDLRREMNQERLRFEQDMAAGRAPEAKALADRIRDANARAGNKELSAAEQEAARIEAEDSQVRLDQMFENRPGVRRARVAADEADAALARERDRIARANEMRQRRFGGLDSGLRGAIGAGGVGETSLQSALSLNEEMRQLQRDMEAALAAGIDKPFEELMDDLRKRIEDVNAGILDEQITQALARSKTTEGQLEAAGRNLERVGISDLQGPMAEMDARRRYLERRRDEAIAENTPEGDRRAAELQRDIDAQNELAAEVLAAAVAVGAFQAALERAAMALQDTLVGETAGRANEARRQANEAAAVFGANSPEAKAARERQDRAEESMRAAQSERDQAAAAINEERIKFERDIRNGNDPAAKARAEKIAQLEKDAEDKSKSMAERNAAREEADRLRRDQERDFESRPEVRKQRERADAADQEMARRQSVERGIEAAKTDEQKKREDLRRQTADIGNAFKAGAINAVDVRRAASEMARNAAPLYAQFGDEIRTARLQGPSRAALNASDVSTSQGAAELNRLIRGENSGKDVNLAEMQKQSKLLEAIEIAVRQSAGVVVNF